MPLRGELSNEQKLSGALSPSKKELTAILSKLSGMNGSLSNEILRGFSAYQLAVASGFEGSEEEWLASLKGESIQLRANEGKIEWKYQSEEEWRFLIDFTVSDYEALFNKPSINKVEIIGDLTLDELGIQSIGDYVETEDLEILSNQEIEDEFKF